MTAGVGLSQDLQILLMGVGRLLRRSWLGFRGRGQQSAWPLSPSYYHNLVGEDLVGSLSFRDGSVRDWQAALRPVLARLVGRRHFPPTPLRVEVCWERELPQGCVQKVLLHPEPGTWIPAYLCLPARGRTPFPVMICLQGHSSGMHRSIALDRWRESIPIRVDGDRDLAIGCMSRGVAALCIEQRALGQRTELHNRWQRLNWYECGEAAMHALLLGETLIGQRVRDVDFGIDFLEGLGCLDLDRLGILGQSGGGTVTAYAAALLPRLRVAVVCSAFGAFRESLLARLHCPDNYIPGILRYCDMGDVLGLFAPKPVIVVGGAQDPIFPFAGFERATAQLKRIYGASAADAHCHSIAVDGGHRFYAREIWEKLLPYLEPRTS